MSLLDRLRGRRNARSGSGRGARRASRGADRRTGRGGHAPRESAPAGTTGARQHDVADRARSRRLAVRADRRRVAGSSLLVAAARPRAGICDRRDRDPRTRNRRQRCHLRADQRPGAASPPGPRSPGTSATPARAEWRHQPELHISAGAGAGGASRGVRQPRRIQQRHAPCGSTEWLRGDQRGMGQRRVLQHVGPYALSPDGSSNRRTISVAPPRSRSSPTAIGHAGWRNAPTSSGNPSSSRACR